MALSISGQSESQNFIRLTKFNSATWFWAIAKVAHKLTWSLNFIPVPGRRNGNLQPFFPLESTRNQIKLTSTQFFMTQEKVSKMRISSKEKKRGSVIKIRSRSFVYIRKSPRLQVSAISELQVLEMAESLIAKNVKINHPRVIFERWAALWNGP